MKKILLSLLLAGTVQNSFAMGSCGGGQAAESGFRLEGRIPVIFRDGLVVYLDLQRLKELNSGLLEGMLFTADGLSRLGEFSEDNTLVMEEFTNLADFEKFEKILKLPLQGEIADMVDFFKKADFLGINTDDHLKGLLARDKAQFFKLCLALLAENPGFVFNMQRVYPEILYHAVRTEDPDFAKMLIDAGADVKIIDKIGMTLLMIAARNGHCPAEIARLFIAECVDVDARNIYGYTALMMAADNGRTEIAQLLIDAHADVNASTSYGETALIYAARNGHTEIAQLLIAANADVDAINSCGRTALIWAAIYGYTEIVQLLIAANADINAIGNDAMTALINAAFMCYTETVGLLIAAGADVNAKDFLGQTALMIATRNGHAEIEKLLRDAGAS